MQRIVWFFILQCFVQISFGQLHYKYTVDLNKLEDDKLTIELITPNIKTDDIVFYLPKIVPGTYSIYNFGRFMTDFEAFDIAGNKLNTQLLNVNSMKISNAKALYKIVYKIDDTFDDTGDNFIFQPAGLNFEEGKNFQLNTFGLFGYFEGLMSIPFDLYIKPPTGFFGSTAMESMDVSSEMENTDGFRANSYFELADLPIMYCKPDTATLTVGGAQILFSVFSEDNKQYAKELSIRLSKIVGAAENYLFGKLPIKKYAFLIYLFDPNADRVGGIYSSGALEHTSSSVYYMPILPKKEFGDYMADVASHEFLHIITPLNIHSEEIGYFDFQNPKMSKHLWLYEGATEYNSKYIQLQSDLISMDDFIKDMESKIKTSKQQFNDTMPFTVMSLNCLADQNAYMNVYQKGALINFCLDVELRSLSNGNYGLQQLIRDLALKYGKDKPFKDADLFNDITALTFPEIRIFFAKYVEGNQPLPLKETLSKIGLDYIENGSKNDFSFGFNKLGFDMSNGKYKINSDESIDDFGKILGYKKGDLIKSINGVEVNYKNLKVLKELILPTLKGGEPINVEVLRAKKEGKKPKPKALTANFQKVKIAVPFELKKSNNFSDSQKLLNKQWWSEKP